MPCCAVLTLLLFSVRAVQCSAVDGQEGNYNMVWCGALR